MSVCTMFMTGALFLKNIFAELKLTTMYHFSLQVHIFLTINSPMYAACNILNKIE